MILRLIQKWKGEHEGIMLGRFMGSKDAFETWSRKMFDHIWYYDPEDLFVGCLGFLDDSIFAASSQSDMNSMFLDVWKELEVMCLRPQPRKLKIMANQWVTDTDVVVSMGSYVAEEVESMEILGSVFSVDISEKGAYQHRITQSWNIFHKW